MNKSGAATDCTESLIARAADEYVDRLDAGENPPFEEFVARYPRLAAVLPQILGTLRTLKLVGRGADESLPGDEPSEALAETVGRLGDFRLIREVGRGGMGIVYEAEQISLGRRVALKVLPFAAVLDDRQLARFKNEARAAATLHHTNIVPVFSVGCEKGVHFYAMQFIEGHSLAQMIESLRGEPPRSEPPGLPRRSAGIKDVGEIPAPLAETVAQRCSQSTLRADSTPPASSLPPQNTPAFYRAIARLGIQAAEALQHAHQHGVLHRDIKPANLMLDAAGNLWITDFGLARLETDAGMTMTGDLLGTLRYMSPEQALGKRIAIDHRTDIYSLGVTLYELLAQAPPFAGEDRASVLRKVAFEEPKFLRRCNQTIPRELETIIAKAIEKSPDHRYPTSQEMADDLLRFMDDKPIIARPPSWLIRSQKWVRRHRPVVWATAVTLLMSAFAVAGNIGWAVRDRAARQMEAEGTAGLVLNEVERLLGRGKWPEALAALERAEDLLAGYSAGKLSPRAQQLRKDVEMVQRLEEIRLSPATETASHANGSLYDPESDRKYSDAFREYGIDVLALGPSDAAERIKLSRVRLELATALDVWAVWRRRFAAEKAWKPLVEIARAVDPDPWRNSLRDALETKLPERKAALIELAASADGKSLPLATVALLCSHLHNDGAPEQAVQLLRAAHRRHPNDYRIIFLLALCHRSSDPPQLEEAIRYYTALLVIRPQSNAAHNSLGIALSHKGLLDEAIACYEEAIRLDPSDAMLHYNLGLTLAQKHLLREAIASMREAIRLKPDMAEPHNMLGAVLREKGMLDEAIASHREAIRLRPNYCYAHNCLGNALADNGLMDEAIASLRQAIRLQPDAAGAHRDLGKALQAKGLLDEAIASFREAIRLKPDYVDAHIDLGLALLGKGMRDEAVSCYRKAIECDPGRRSWVAYYNLGHVLLEMRRLDEAIAVYRQAVRVNPNEGGLHHFLGVSLRKAGAVDEAIVCAKEAVRLNPDNEAAHAALGHALLEKGDLDSAIESLEKSIQLSVGYALKHGVYDLLAQALRRKGGPDAIIAYYEEALREQPDSAGVHLGLAAALGKKGDLDRARQLLRRVRRETLENPEVLNVYSALLLILGDTQQYETVRREVAARLSAIDNESHLRAAILLCCLAPLDELLAKQLVELVEKEGFTSRTTKGLVQYRAGNWQQAKEIFLAAQRQVPNSINYHLGLALTCHRLNELDEARRWFERGERALREQDVAYDFRLKHYDLIVSQLLHREAAELLAVTNQKQHQRSRPRPPEP